MIINNWLYLQPEKGKRSNYRRSELANMLLSHGAGFEGEPDLTMSCIIIENYSNYLNKRGEISIEDLAIEHWFNFWSIFKKDLKKKHFKERMEIWLQSKAYKKTHNTNNIFSCIIF